MNLNRSLSCTLKLANEFQRKLLINPQLELIKLANSTFTFKCTNSVKTPKSTTKPKPPIKQ